MAGADISLWQQSIANMLWWSLATAQGLFGYHYCPSGSDGLHSSFLFWMIFSLNLGPIQPSSTNICQSVCLSVCLSRCVAQDHQQHPAVHTEGVRKGRVRGCGFWC